MKKLLLGSFMFAALSAVQMQGQELPKVFGRTVKSVNPENGLVRCASTEYEQYLQEKYPERETRDEFETIIKKKIKERRANPTLKSTTAVITIPVVVHVIHNGDAVGSNENISDEQVLSQITVLNQDYRKMVGTPGYNDNEVGADVEIEFCLAKIDPDGNPTNGIDRVDLGVASWNTESSIETSLKPSTQWTPSKYFNIWVCNFGGSMSDILGYAQFPTTSSVPGLAGLGGYSNTDGVIIGYKYFGSSAIYPQGTYQFPYNRGRTTTHEIGHCLGLFHVDGDNPTCTVNASDSTKDYCPDTPAIYELHYYCTAEDSCPSQPGVDMIENYMDYTPDSCMNIFTEDQKERMLAVMDVATRRASLKTSDVCQLTAGTEDLQKLVGLSVYPNPAQTVLNINMPDGELPDSYTVLNSLGQVVATVKVSGVADLTVNTSAYANGVYFIKVDKGSQSKTLKFAKN